MPYERPGRGVNLLADETLEHGTPHYQAGFAGVPQKQDNPKSLDSLATRTAIASGVKYFLRLKGVCEVANTGMTTLVPGDPVYIHKTTDALSTTPSAGANVPFGRVAANGGTTVSPNANPYGTRPGFIRIHMDARDTITVP